MNLKTTIALFILAAGVGALVWKGGDLAPKVGLAPSPAPEAKGASAEALAGIIPDQVTEITVRAPGSAPVEFKSAGSGKPLELPGNWPVRRNEVAELVATVTGLKSRFQPVPVGPNDDLKQYGLAKTQDPVVVEVVTPSAKHSLTVGEAPAQPGENPFTRPAFVRVDDQPEVLRLGPDVLPILRRPADFYRKRQLFPDAERVKVADNSRMAQDATPVFLAGDAVTAISVEGPQGKFVLKRTGPSPKPQPPPDKSGGGEAVVVAGRIADVWEIAEPLRDRADPAKLKSVLAAVPEIWVEQFLVNTDPLGVLMSGISAGVGDSPVSGLASVGLGVIATTGPQAEHDALVRRGLAPKPPELSGPSLPLVGATFLAWAGTIVQDEPRKLTISLEQGTSRRVVLGKATRTSVRTESPPPPPFPMAPPPPPKIVEEKYYYAKLADNPLIFEVKGDKLADLLIETARAEGPKLDAPGPAFQQLRDPNAARFEADNVVSVSVARPGQKLELRKTKGDPKAESEAAKRDRWDLMAPFTGLAESRQVSDLLDPLERLAAQKGQIIDRPILHLVTGGLGMADLAAAGLTPDQATVVTITSDPKSGTPPRTVTIGRHDAAGKKMFVMGAGAGRINVVEDAAYAVVERPPRTYRALKLFDLGDGRVESIVAQTEKGSFHLQENVGTTATTFILVDPVKADADPEKARNLLKDLGTLEATEYVYDPPTESESTAVRAFLGPLGSALLDLAAGAHGLDKPAATVNLHFAGPTKLPARTLFIGKAREGKPEVFARLDGSKTVFTIKKEVADGLTGGSLGLLPLQLWNGSPDGLAVVQVQRGTETPFSLKREGGAWKVTAPFEAPVDNAAVIPLTSAVSAMRAEKYAAHAASNPAEYGLDQPALRIKFTLTERKVNKPGEEPKEETKERTLLVGKAEGNGKPGRYARLEGDANASVFVINETTFKDLDKPALELLDKKLVAMLPSAATKLEIAGPDGPLTLQKEGADWKPVGATFPVDRPTVDNLLRMLANLTALKFADYGDKVDWAKYGLDPNSKPQTVSVTAGTETHKLAIGKVVEGTPNDRYARVDDGKGVAVLPVTVARELSKGKLELVERTIFKFDSIDLQGIRRSMGGQEFEATLEGTSWTVSKPAKIPADQQGMEELADRLSALRAERVADVEGKDKAKYGLDKPAAVLKLELIGKGAKPYERALTIGGPVDPMKPDGERYVQSEGATTVVVLAAPMSKRLLAEPLKFRERNLASFVTADKVIVTRDGRDVTFVKEGGNWKMTSPIKTDAEDEALRELHDSLARLRAEEIVAEKPGDLKPYGLDKPERWRVYNGDREVLNLLVGAREKVGDPGKQKDGLRAYAKLEKGELVVLLDMSLTSKLAAEYRKRGLWEPLDVAQATSIEVETPDGPGSFKLMKGPIGWMDPAHPTERINPEAVTEFLDAFAGLKADRFIEHEAKDSGKLYGLDPPKKTLIVTTQSGQKRMLPLGRLDESKRVYARPDERSGKAVVVLSQADTNNLNRDRGAFQAATDKKEPEPKKAIEIKNGGGEKKDPKAEPKKEPEPKKDESKKD